MTADDLVTLMTGEATDREWTMIHDVLVRAGYWTDCSECGWTNPTQDRPGPTAAPFQCEECGASLVVSA